MFKYLMLSDGHFSFKLCPAEIEAILRSTVNLLGEDSWLASRIIEHYDKQRLEHMWSAFTKAETFGPFDGLISLGDNFYDWDNLGLDSIAKLDEAKELKHRLLDHFSLHDKRHVWVPGNHDLGYLNCTFASCGPSYPPEKNFSCYRDIYGPTYGVKQLNDYYSAVWLSTVHIETLTAKPDKTDDEKLEFLVAQQHEELEFLDETLENIEGRFFFGIHDPGSFLSPQLSAILNRHLDKLAGSFTGHLHAEWLLKLAKIYRPSFRPAFHRYKVQFIPSIWGIVLPFFFWSTGAGWAELNLNGERAELTQHMLGIKRVKRFVL